MTVQDDRRENELITLFQLKKPPNATRSGTDAILDLNGLIIPFELKSTTSSSVTTVRDFGLDHIKKWQGKHWLFGFYNREGTELKYCLYASPQVMAQWISQKEAYISCSSFKSYYQELQNPCSATILVATDTQFKCVTAYYQTIN